jgi:ribosome-binding protein aMBF1 (putative translation factor)
MLKTKKEKMDGQDWNPVVLSKKKNQLNSNSNVNEKKEDGVPPVVNFYSREFCQRISQLRVKNNWTRKDLAGKLKIKETDLAAIENCKPTMPYKGSFVDLCNRVFGEVVSPK